MRIFFFFLILRTYRWPWEVLIRRRSILMSCDAVWLFTRIYNLTLIEILLSIMQFTHSRKNNCLTVTSKGSQNRLNYLVCIFFFFFANFARRTSRYEITDVSFGFAKYRNIFPTFETYDCLVMSSPRISNTRIQVRVLNFFRTRYVERAVWIFH